MITIETAKFSKFAYRGGGGQYTDYQTQPGLEPRRDVQTTPRILWSQPSDSLSAKEIEELWSKEQDQDTKKKRKKKRKSDKDRESLDRRESPDHETIPKRML